MPNNKTGLTITNMLKRLKEEYNHLPPSSRKLVPTFENWLALNFPELVKYYVGK